MFWLQNIIIIIISYLISRIIIEENLHKYLVNILIARSSQNPAYAVSGVLFISYAFSIFLSNTVVVIAFLPIIKIMLDRISDRENRATLTTGFVLALIYGANIGGMASLTGSAFNVLYLGFMEINAIPGRESINFFSWLIVGIPLTLVHLFMAKVVLKTGLPKVLGSGQPVEDLPNVKFGSLQRKIIFPALSIVVLFVLSGIQFVCKPEPVFLNFNLVDIAFILYFIGFLFKVFLLPTTGFKWRSFVRNISYLTLFVSLFPFIAAVEIFREVRTRFKLRGEKIGRELDGLLLTIVNTIWRILHREEISDLKKRNSQQMVPVNRMIYDLPFFGLFFVGLILLIIYVLLKLGDNPATPQLDGHVFVFLKNLLSSLFPPNSGIFSIFLLAVAICIFLSEAIHNITVVSIMLPVIFNLSYMVPFNPVFPLMAVALASSSVFMTPIGTGINALAYSSIEGVNLRQMILKGFILNMLSVGWLTLVVYLLHVVFG